MALYLDGQKIISGGGGHTIVDNEGTSLEQRTNLQFNGAYSEDNATDDTTEINVVREMTKAEFDELTEDEKTGLINVTDVTANADDKFQPVIYSEDEREIGVWTDGKPLYQKTVTKTINCDSEVAVINSTDIPNIDTIVGVSGFLGVSPLSNYETPNYYAYADIMGNNVICKCKWGQLSTVPAIVTIRYTKTTDIAGSGQWTPQGVPAVHYSTDEQVVGTWIDGSTIYEKTIHFVPTNPIEPTTETDLYIEDIPSNMLAVLDITVIGGLKGNSQNIIFRRPFVFNYAKTISSSTFKGSALVVTEVWQNEKHIKVYTGDNYANVVAVSTDNRICELDITLRYTKSSS